MSTVASAAGPEPAEVWLYEGRPARFAWRGRHYAVLAVTGRPPDEAAPGQSRCWRVTASPGRNVPPAGFLLCLDTARDRWSVSRENG